LPGTLLVLRRESLMGDALSHAALPGIILGFLTVDVMYDAGWIAASTLQAARPFALFAGATCTGISCGLLAEFLKRWGRLEPTAALGVVYTSLFAAGLLLIRAFADQAHIDPGCVLYGNLEGVVTDTVTAWGLPRAAVVNGLVLLVNGTLLVACFKELQLCTFDPGLAEALGFRAGWLHVGLLAATGATVVAAFESVGSILVIAMLIVPPATAVLLSDRLTGVFGWSLTLAAAAAVFGHLLALTIPPWLQWLFRLPVEGEVSTSGLIAVASGLLFLLAWLGAPRHGWLRLQFHRRQLQLRILIEDILGVLYRLDEHHAPMATVSTIAAALQVRPWRIRLGLLFLQRGDYVEQTPGGITLTATGRSRGRELVRSHRLWEAYLAQHLGLSDRQLHAAAEAAEHYLSAPERRQIAAELHQPGHDPHGREIPAEPIDTAAPPAAG
jgi:manganese/zinc/iron transport system permease protein